MFRGIRVLALAASVSTHGGEWRVGSVMSEERKLSRYDESSSRAWCGAFAGGRARAVKAEPGAVGLMDIGVGLSGLRFGLSEETWYGL